MNTYIDSRTYLPSEVIPSDTLNEFGEKKMMKKFYDLNKNLLGVTNITGWTVTVRTITDDDEDFAIKRNKNILDTIITRSINAFE